MLVCVWMCVHFKHYTVKVTSIKKYFACNGLFSYNKSICKSGQKKIKILRILTFIYKG